MTITLRCGHVFTDAAEDILLGDRVVCDQCPETIRTNESRTASWSVGHPSQAVIKIAP